MSRTVVRISAGVFVIAVVAAFGVLLPAEIGSASDPTPSPTNSATPSPSPTPTLPPVSTITIRFVRQGQPVEFESLSFPGPVSADGVPCPYPLTQAKTTQFTTAWPFWQPDPRIPEACSKGPPTTVTIDFGPFAAEVLWTGSSIETSVEVPLTGTTVGTASPRTTAAELPRSGGSPGDSTGINSDVTIVVAGILILAIVSTAIGLLRWRDSS